MGKSTTAPDRDQIPALSSFSVELHPDTLAYINDPDALAHSLRGNGKSSTSITRMGQLL